MTKICACEKHQNQINETNNDDLMSWIDSEKELIAGITIFIDSMKEKNATHELSGLEIVRSNAQKALEILEQALELRVANQKG